MAVKLCLMTKIHRLQPRSFTDRKTFPGRAGNPFDRLLHSLEKLERMPSLVMNILLIGLALLGCLPAILKTHTLPLMAGVLALLFFIDWILIALLPETRRSFGPIKVVVLMLACLRVPFALLPYPWNLGFELTGTLLVIYGFYIEPFRVDVHHETLQTAKFASDTSLRVLHLGDLHLERTTKREKWVLQKVKELAPDLILFSGDVLNLSYLQDTQSRAEAVDLFKGLSAPLGVYGVTGSSAVDFNDLFTKLTAETPLIWLDNQGITLDSPGGKINVIGLTCSHNPDQDEPVLVELMQHCQKDAFNLLLYHSPDLAPNASRYDINLQLSGHTHGGQVRLPFFGAFYTGTLYGKTFEAGRYLVNNMPLYITRGLGMEGAIAPRVRFNCRPEMVLWEIVG
jgi:uncharacterized protein